MLRFANSVFPSATRRQPNTRLFSFFSRQSFDNLGVPLRLTRSLARVGITQPSVIQAEAIPKISKGSNTLITAETGSGKTLAYLLPLATRWIRGQGATLHSTILVATATRELAQQVVALGELLGIEPSLTLQSSREVKALPQTDWPGGLIVSTPTLLHRLVTLSNFNGALRHPTTFVVDEADLLLSTGNQQVIDAILQTLATANSELQVVFAAVRTDSDMIRFGILTMVTMATLDSTNHKAAGQWLSQHFNRIEHVKTPGFHRHVAGLTLKTIVIDTKAADRLVDYSTGSDGRYDPDSISTTQDALFQAKLSLVVQVLKEEHRETMSIDTVAEGPRNLEAGQEIVARVGGRGGKSKQEFWFLDTTSGISTPVHGENESNEATQGWSIVGEGASRSVKPTTIIFANTLLVAEAAYAYLETHPELQPLKVGILHKNIPRVSRFQTLKALHDGEIDVVVATDLAARGVDTMGVKHVIQLDCPIDVVTHLHRVGRTGRAGRKGTVTTLLLEGEEDHFRSILDAARYGNPDSFKQAVDRMQAGRRRRTDAQSRKRRSSSHDKRERK